MKYVQPYGITDPEGPYINGDPSIGRQGSIPPAAAFEHPMREIVGVISKSEVAPTSSDLLQLAKSVRSQRMNYVDDTGSANFLSVALDPPLATYTVGLVLRVRVKATNTGPATIDAGAGRVNIRRPDGAAMAAGNLPAGGIVELVYDGTLFQMVNFLGGVGGGGDVINNLVNLPYVVDTSTTSNIITAPFSPAITSLSAGSVILVKVSNNNTGSTVINVNALAPITIKAQGGGDLLPHDVLAGSVFVLVYDGTNFSVVPNPTILSDIQINVPTTQFPTPTSVFEALKRKSISPAATVTVKLASGIYSPFVIDHPSSNRIIVQGTMIGPNPTMSAFAQSGNSAGARAADAATNIVMLRARYGTEVRVPIGFAGAAISVASGTLPKIKDILVAATTYSQVGGATGIGNSSCSLENCSAWGLYNGFYSNGIAAIPAIACWTSGCYWGFVAGEGGRMGCQGGGAFGGVFGYSSSSMSDMACGVTYSRFNSIYGYSAGNVSLCGTSGCDGIGNGIDFYVTNQSLGTVNGSFGSFSPALNTVGNNNSTMMTA